MEFSGLTNERRGMDYIPNAQLDARSCSNCGATWERCLQGWDETDVHPAGVCCATCHNTDTHEADAARRRYRERPSGDALDRATALLAKRYISVTQTPALVEDIAKLIDAADAAAGKEQVNGHGALHWYTTAKRRMDQINELDGVVRRRNDRVAELEFELATGRQSDRAAAARSSALESELQIVKRQLEIADRQRREFLEHSRTANAARQEVERERDRLRYDRNEAMAQKAIAETGALTTATTDTLLEELRRRLNT